MDSHKDPESKPTSVKSTPEVSLSSSAAPSATPETTPIATLSTEDKIDAEGVHAAYVELVLYAHNNGLDVLLSSSNLKAIAENAIAMFMSIGGDELAGQLLDPKVKFADREAKLSLLGGHLNSAVLPSDSCGQTANEIVELFLTREHCDKLKYVGKEKVAFTKLEEESALIFSGVAASYLNPLVRIEVSRVEKAKEIQSHSYCLFSLNNDRAYVYQSYFGGYGMANWFHDPKFKPIEISTYCEQLAHIAGTDPKARQQAYGEAFRLTGTETETPVKPPLNVMYRMEPVDLQFAFDNIKAKQLELQAAAKLCAGISADEYLRNACWQSLQINLKKDVTGLRREVETVQAEIEQITKISNTFPRRAPLHPSSSLGEAKTPYYSASSSSHKAPVSLPLTSSSKPPGVIQNPSEAKTPLSVSSTVHAVSEQHTSTSSGTGHVTSPPPSVQSTTAAHTLVSDNPLSPAPSGVQLSITLPSSTPTHLNIEAPKKS